jgi:histone H3/H4
MKRSAAAPQELPSRLVARLHRTMLRHAEAPIPELHLRRFFRSVVREVRARGLAIERLLAAMASLWRSLPPQGLSTIDRQQHDARRMLLVRVCIDEFYAH